MAAGTLLLNAKGFSAGGQLALLLGTTADSGDPSASDAVLRESSRVAAAVAFFRPTDFSRWTNSRAFPATATLTEAEAAQYSPVRFVSPGAALTKVGVPASLIRIQGTAHGFERADLERTNAAMVQWFERHLGTAAK